MANRKLLVATVLLASLSMAVGWGGFAKWYNCDESACQGATNCVCASADPPGGISSTDAPQLVLVTHDDAITEMSDNVVRYVLDGFKNPNGCNLPATMFTLANEDTDCALAQRLHANNYEIATHTLSHLNMDASFTGDRAAEIVGARTKLASSCKLPLEDLVGFRAPYLINSPEIRKILSSNGFLYDSSINEHFPSSTSRDGASRLWPYTMDHGIIQNCNWTSPDGNCNTDERYPGLWSVPVWDLQNEDHSKSFTMDPAGDVFGYLKNMFDWSYEGNRAPMPLYVHAPWFTYEHANATKAFIEYALTKPNTYFVTMSQLVKYMRAPVAAADAGSVFTCKPVQLTPPANLYCTKYAVQAGETLAAIGARFKVPDDAVSALLEVNPELRGNATVAPGTLIRIAPWKTNCDPIPLFIAPVGAPANAPAPSCRSYKVKSGDSLWSISVAAAVDMNELAKVNNIALPQGLITDGQVLGIPPYPACCQTNTCAPAVAPAPAAAAVPETGLQIDAKISGVTQASFDAAAQAKVATAFATLLGTAPTSVVVESVAPYTGRRLAQAMASTGATPSSTLAVSMFVSGADPIALYTTAKSSVSKMSTALQGVGLSMVQDPVFTPFKDGKAMAIPEVAVPVPAPAPAPAPEAAAAPEEVAAPSGGGSSFPIWIIGVVVGAVAAVAIVAIVVALVMKKKREQAAAMPMHSSSYAGRPAAGATAVLRTGSGPKTAIDADRFVVVKGGSTPSTPTRRNTAFN